MRKLIKQIINFGIVGVISFIIDYSIFWILSEKLHVYYLIANACSFTCSVIINYILNLKYVFSSSGSNKKREFVMYIILNIIGLGINQIVMKICVAFLNIVALGAKIIATGVVMVYNFISRKILIEK